MRQLYVPATGQKWDLSGARPALAAEIVEVGTPMSLAISLAADDRWWHVVDEARDIALSQDQVFDARGLPAHPLERLAGFAKIYAGKHLLGRLAIARLLEIAAQGPTRESAGQLMAAYAGMATAYADAPPADGARQRAPRDAIRTEFGVRAIVSRGAGRCLTCGKQLVETRLGRARREYHERCLPCDPCRRESLRAADREAIRRVLDAAAAQLFRGVHRPRERRVSYAARRAA